MSRDEAVLAYVGLGSNLQQPVEQVKRALQALAELPETRLVARSSLYRTRPVGPADQPDYVNAVAALATRLDPESLLDRLQDQERLQGRVREGERWGPRTLDLDLLIYGDELIDSLRLQVPHPQVAQRAFVLIPLAEIAPADLRIPGRGALGELRSGVSEADIERLD